VRRIQPSSAAAFGKILKMAFPTVKCNRVGPRGASKHHYRYPTSPRGNRTEQNRADDDDDDDHDG
jgi:hypothetical protein